MSHSQEERIVGLEKSNKYYRIGIILLVVFIIGFWVAYLFGKKTERYNITNNSYPLVDPSREFIPQEDFITSLKPLRDYLAAVGVKEGNNISIYYEQLNSGANISVHKDQRFYLASLVKLPVAMIAMKKLEDGTWNWDTDFKVEPQDFNDRSGTLYQNPKDQYSFQELLEALIIDSDNTANNIFTRNFTTDDFQSIVDEVGLEDVYDSKFLGSAKEYSRILRSLYTSSYLERDGSEKILELMAQAKWNKFLSQGIPDGVKFSHKYGENTDYHIFADSGIVYASHHPYMLTVVYQGADGSPASEKKAEDLMQEISTQAYNLGK